MLKLLLHCSRIALHSLAKVIECVSIFYNRYYPILEENQVLRFNRNFPRAPMPGHKDFVHKMECVSTPPQRLPNIYPMTFRNDLVDRPLSYSGKKICPIRGMANGIHYRETRVWFTDIRF
jgi:hypothetical protein